MQVTLKGENLETIGTPIDLGAKMPEFEVKDQTGNIQSSNNLFNRISLVSVVPNINTSVCSVSTKHFNQEVDKFTGINFYTISTNTPEEQKNWCAAEGVDKMVLLSDDEHDFGKKSGLFIQTAGIDARSVWVVDETGKVLYREIISEITDYPNYEAALNFLASLS